MKIYEVNTKKMHHRHAGDTEVAAAHQVAAKVTGRRLETLRALSTLGGGSGEQISASQPSRKRSRSRLVTCSMQWARLRSNTL